MSGERQVAVIGGGVGGLAAAVALQRVGIAAHVLERAPKLRLSGGALILWCNALKALDALGLRTALRLAPSTQVVENAEFRRETGEFLSSMPVGDVGRRHDAESIVISRRDLLLTLFAEVERVEFNVAFEDLSVTGGGVVVNLAGGAERRFDALIGADGLHSRVRKRIGAEQPLRHAQQELWVGTTTACPDDVTGGSTVASIGAGQRFWYTRLGDGRAFWYATLRTDRHAPRTLAELASLYRDWHDPIPELIRLTDTTDLVRTPMRDRAPSLPWGTGPITLLGDAAHAMTPDLGQGACQAIESAWSLAECVRGEPDFAAAFRAYEQRRFSRTAEITRMSWIVSHTSGAADRIACAARDAAIRFGLRNTVMTQLDWLFAGPC